MQNVKGQRGGGLGGKWIALVGFLSHSQSGATILPKKGIYFALFSANLQRNMMFNFEIVLEITVFV